LNLIFTFHKSPAKDIAHIARLVTADRLARIAIRQIPIIAFFFLEIATNWGAVEGLKGESLKG
jgi:hypothetical protein